MSAIIPQDKIRNIAIIAHVDHGKTTLVDAIMKQSHLFRDNQDEMNQTQILDSGDLEREKGITILAKNISIHYKDIKINIIDTPGHADFGGEVERTLSMADGCLLLVDAQEGVMPQTKVVLKKALELGLKPMVLVNKIDKKLADIKNTVNEVQNLFLDLATRDDQLDFPLFYGISREGKVFKELPKENLFEPNSTTGDVTPILDAVIDYIPSPKGDMDGPFQMQVNALDFDAHTGRYMIGKINRGIIKLNDPVILVVNDEPDAKQIQGRVRKLFTKEGMNYLEVTQAGVGDIIAIAGIDSTAIGGTICALGKVEPLPSLKISPPSVSIKFEANTSPLVGQEGKFVTASLLQKRLQNEAEVNTSLDIKDAGGSAYIVSGRGELQLSILIETLRREGYEFQVRKPEVIVREINGVKMEPMDSLFIEVPDQYLSVVTQEVSGRKGELVDMRSFNGITRFEYKCLTRNIFGLRNYLITETKGSAVFSSTFLEYVPKQPATNIYRKGVIVSSDTGDARAYAMNMVQDRGVLFIKPSDKLYEGMIIGINKYEDDLEVNACKERHKTSVRMNQAEVTQVSLNQPFPLTLEFALSFLNEDEILEVTPMNLRMRKQYLTRTEREWSKRKNLSAFAKKQMGVS
ncbi:GTP-binding protein [Candidatus Dojkabacteria bacterium]|nr:GTP-binding protein [Candidatus Dojkabacteria bacterium]